MVRAFPLSAANPYGRSKLMVEDMSRDIAHADTSWRIALLRYFNPVGAHQSGLIGEDPSGVPSKLMPYIAKVADGTTANLGTGQGYSVLDMVHAFEAASGKKVPYEITARRPGDTLRTMPIRRSQGRFWAGKAGTASMRCAAMPGDGNRCRRLLPKDFYCLERGGNT